MSKDFPEPGESWADSKGQIRWYCRREGDRVRYRKMTKWHTWGEIRLTSLKRFMKWSADAHRCEQPMRLLD